MESQVDINTCTDTCTHSKQGVGTEVEWLQHTHSATQEPMFPCKYANGMKQTLGVKQT